MNPGIYDNVPMDEYLNMRGFSASKAHTLLTRSSYHAWRGIKSEPTEASDSGTSIHDALLEGIDRIDAIDPAEYRSKPTKTHPEGNIPDGWTNNAIRAARDASRLAGRIPMLLDDVQGIKDAVDAALTHVRKSPLAGIFERGKPEQTIVWQEGEITCKARPDWLTDERDVLCHVKTTKGSARPEAWIRSQLENMGYDVAAAFYQRGLAEADYLLRREHGIAEGKSMMDKPTVTEHVFLVIEQSPPHGCSLVGLSPAMWSIAQGKVERAIRTWQQCVASGKYPAYPTAIHYAEPTPWQMEGALERGDVDSLSWDERLELGSQA